MYVFMMLKSCRSPRPFVHFQSFFLKDRNQSIFIYHINLLLTHALLYPKAVFGFWPWRLLLPWLHQTLKMSVPGARFPFKLPTFLCVHKQPRQGESRVNKMMKNVGQEAVLYLVLFYPLTNKGMGCYFGSPRR